MAGLLKGIELEISALPNAVSGYRFWRLELSDLVSLRFSAIDVSSELSPTFMKINDAGYANTYDAAGTAAQKQSATENRILACLLRRAVVGTDAESIVMTMVPGERVSGTHLLRLIDELHRSKASVSVMQTERDRLRKLPRINVAGFDCASTCLKTWASAILRDQASVNEYANKDVDTGAGVMRKLNLKLTVSDHEVSQRIMERLAVHPAFGRPTVLARLRTKMRGAEFLGDDDLFSLEKFVSALTKSFQGYTVDGPATGNAQAAFSIDGPRFNGPRFNVNKAFGNVRSSDRDSKGFNPRHKCFLCKRVGHMTHMCSTCFPNGTGTTPCPHGDKCFHWRDNRNCVYKHDGTRGNDQRGQQSRPKQHRNAGVGRNVHQMNAHHGNNRYKPNQSFNGRRTGSRASKPKHRHGNKRQVSWLDMPLDKVSAAISGKTLKNVDFSKIAASQIGAVFTHEVCMLKRNACDERVHMLEQREPLVQTGSQTRWLLDSGASVHVVNNRALLHNAQDQLSGGTVAAAGGTEMQITAVGEVHLMIPHQVPGLLDNEQTVESRLVVIENVWCCPGVRHQVLSTKRLTNQLDVTYVKQPNRTGVLMRNAPRECINLHTSSNGLEFLHGNIIMPQEIMSISDGSTREQDFSELLKTTPTSVERQLWRVRLAAAHRVFVCPEAQAPRSKWLSLHHRLGHRNPVSTCKLLKMMNVSTANMTRQEKNFCYSCGVAKITFQPVRRHVNSKKLKVVAPADLHMCTHLNLDLSGPHPPSINGGYLYSMIVACRSTRYKWCQGLKQKSDVYSELRKVLADASRFKPEGVSFEITTDSDPLFGMRCSAWQEVLREFKAVHTAVGARRQWMNSGAERSIRTLSESSKALRHAAGLDDSFWLLSQQYACHVDRFLPRAALGWESPQTVTGRPQAKIEYFVPFGCMGAYKTPPENADGCRGKLGMVVGTCTATDYATIMLTRTKAGNLSFIKSHHVTFDQSSPAAMQLGDDSGEVCVPPREQWDRILTDESVVPGYVSANLRMRQSGQPDRSVRVHGFNRPGESALVVPSSGQPAGQVVVPIQAVPADAEGDVLDLDAIGNSQTNAPNDITIDVAPIAANQTAQANPISTTITPFRMNLRSRASKAVNVLETLGSDTSSSHIMVPTKENTLLLDTSPLNVNDEHICLLGNIDIRDRQRVDGLRLKNQMLRLRNKHCVHLIVGKQFPSKTAALKACPAHLQPKVLAAVKNEIENLILTGTIKPISDRLIPRRYRRVPSQMLIKVKTNPDLNIDSARLKARLVVMGNRQLPQVHFFSSTAACPKLSSILMIIATGALRGKKVWSFDVPAAFTKSEAEPNIDLCYTSLPKDIEQIGKDGSPIKYQVTASLYGCASAPRQWLLMLAKFMASQGFKQIEGDVCVWVRAVDTPDFIVFGIHVDDAIGYAIKDEVMDNFLEAVKARFDADAEPAEFFLGLNIKQKLGNKTGNGTHICQSTYIRSMLIKYLCDGDEDGLENLPTRTTPLPRGTRIDRNLVPVTPIKQPFRSLLGACMYAANAVRWDIKGAINSLSRVAHQPHQEHWDLLVHVCHYLKGTQTLGTHYRPGRVRIETKLSTPAADNHAGTQLIAFSDSSHADLNWLCLCPDCVRKHKATSATDDSKCSTVSYVCTIAGGITDSFATVDTVQRYGSPNDSETAALAKAAKRVAHMKMIAEGMSVPQAAVPTYSDSAGSIARCTKEWSNKTATRSLELRFALIRDHIKRGTIDLRKVASSLNSSDLNTKQLCKHSFTRLRDQWMVTLEKAMQTED